MSFESADEPQKKINSFEYVYRDFRLLSSSRFGESKIITNKFNNVPNSLITYRPLS